MSSLTPAGSPTAADESQLAALGYALAINHSGTRILAPMARIGLTAELIGVIVLGLYLLLFQREQPFSIFFDRLAPAATRRT